MAMSEAEVRWCQRDAESGDALAQSLLGYLYEHGDGVAKNSAQAVFWYQRAAEQGYAIAQLTLGDKYDSGDGVPKNPGLAVKWFRLAAEQGLADAQYSLGTMYSTGNGVAKDAVQAVFWYRRAAEQGLPKAEYNLGASYDSGEGVAKNPGQAAYWYQRAARQKFALAQFNLGVAYDTGNGVAQDSTKAARWFLRAAQLGQVHAQFRLGVKLGAGDGVEKDLAKAFFWFQRAAEQGHAEAQYNLGVACCNGYGVAKDPVRATYWFQRAAEQGLAESQFFLGVRLANGDGIAKDAAQAVHWYLRAAEQGFAKAQFSLGAAYDFGEGVAKDPTQAIRWYRFSAVKGHLLAQFNLGVKYDAGEGVAKDPAQAVCWYQRAAERGHKGAQFNLAVKYSIGDGIAKDPVQALRLYQRAADQGMAEAQFNVALDAFSRESFDESIMLLKRSARSENRVIAASSRIYLGHSVFLRWAASVGDGADTFDSSMRLLDMEFEDGLFTAYTCAPRGGFGRVLVGKHSPTRLAAAVKIIDAPHVPPDMFARETIVYRAISSHVNKAMRDPHAIGGWQYVNVIYGSGWVHDLSTEDVRLPRCGASLLVMEPLDETLSDRLRRAGGPLPVADVARILYQCAMGIACLSSGSIIVSAISHMGYVFLHFTCPPLQHGDVKLANIMFHSDGRAVLCDFGLGRITSSHAGASALGVSAFRGGTCDYLAPELLGGSRLASTEASDVFALACVGHCLLTGTPRPWYGISSDRTHIEQLVVRGERPSVSVVPPDIPPELQDWVTRCWAQNPSHRPTALQAAEVLRSFFPAVTNDVGDYMPQSVKPLPALNDPLSSYAIDEFLSASLVPLPAQLSGPRDDDSRSRVFEGARDASIDSAARSHAEHLPPINGSAVQFHALMPQPPPEALDTIAASSVVSSSHAELHGLLPEPPPGTEAGWIAGDPSTEYIAPAT